MKKCIKLRSKNKDERQDHLESNKRVDGWCESICGTRGLSLSELLVEKLSKRCRDFPLQKDCVVAQESLFGEILFFDEVLCFIEELFFWRKL